MIRGMRIMLLQVSVIIISMYYQEREDLMASGQQKQETILSHLHIRFCEVLMTIRIFTSYSGKKYHLALQRIFVRILKRALLFLVCLSLLPVLAGCSEESKTIEGYLLEYYTVPEYTHPLGRVVERSGEEHIVVLFCEDVNAALLGEDDERVKDQILNRTLTNIYIKISYGAEDKTIVLNGKEVTVYNAYHISVMKSPVP